MDDSNQKELFDKIKREDKNFDKLKDMIKECKNINIIDAAYDGRNLLEEIVYDYGYDCPDKDIESVIKILIEKGIDINYQDWYGDTALHMAIYSRSYQIMKLLLENGANPNIIAFEESETVLDFAQSEYFMSDNKKDDAKLRDIIKLLLHYNGKPKKLLFTKELNTYLLVQTGYWGYPTGLFTLNGNILIEDIPNIEKDICDEFMYWLLNGPAEWLFRKDPNHPLVIDYYKKQEYFTEYFKKVLSDKIIVDNDSVKIAEKICEQKKDDYRKNRTPA